MTDPIDAYLDRLVVELRGRAPDVRRVLAEVEHHLDDAVAAAIASGASPDDARRLAVERLGSPRTVARRFALSPTAAGLGALVRQLMVALALLGGVGLVAVGASGALAAGMGAAFGRDFVAGDPAGITYTAGRCAEFMEYEPHARTCASAAVAHHYGEVVGYRVDAGILGVLILGGVWLARRRWGSDDLLLPDGFVPIIAVSLFGAAAGLLLLQSLGQGVIGGETNGVGQWLSGGMVATMMAAAYLVPLARMLLVRAPQPEGLPPHR
jgi:hypothetical protein